MPLPANWVDGVLNAYTSTAENNTIATLNAIGAGTQVIPKRVSDITTTPFTLTTAYNVWVYKGTAAGAWTLPLIANSINSMLLIHNRTTYILTMSRNGSDQIYRKNVTLTSRDIVAGYSALFFNDGTYWLMIG